MPTVVLGCHARCAGAAAAGAEREQVEVVLLARTIADAIAAARCPHLRVLR